MSNKQVEESIKSLVKTLEENEGISLGDDILPYVYTAFSTLIEQVQDRIIRRLSVTIGAVEMGLINKEQGFDDFVHQLQTLTEDLTK